MHRPLINATKIKDQEESNGRRNLAQILVSDFKINHDQIFSEVAGFYGFRKISLKEENIDKNRIVYIRKMFELLPEIIQEQMKKEKIIVLKNDEHKADKLIFVAADPTNHKIPDIARALGAKRYEVYYAALNELQYLFDLVFPPENEFLKTLQESEVEIEDEIEEETLDEAAIEAEINKSILVNLVEGMLLELGLRILHKQRFH